MIPLTLLVYLAISAATSAEAIGICTSPGIEEEEHAVLDTAAIAAEAVLLVTRVTADEDELPNGLSFC